MYIYIDGVCLCNAIVNLNKNSHLISVVFVSGCVDTKWKREYYKV